MDPAMEDIINIPQEAMTMTDEQNMDGSDNNKLNSIILQERSSSNNNNHELLLRRVVSVDEESPQTKGKQHKPQNMPQSTCLSKTVSSISPKEERPKLLSLLHDSKNTNSDRSTVLSSLIADEQYWEASRRVREHPEEASVWVVMQPIGGGSPRKASKLLAPPRDLFRGLNGLNNDNDDNETTYERLPIHMACGNLAFASESKLRFQLEQLILRLALTFPEGCSLVDYYDNRLPLHEALWNNASPETISMLLMADPTSMFIKDQCGRNAAEVNRHRCGVFVDQVKDLLSMGLNFWEDARGKAANRFGNHLPYVGAKTAEEQHRPPSFCFADNGGGDISAYDSSLTIDLESESILSESLNSMFEFKSTFPQQLQESGTNLSLPLSNNDGTKNSKTKQHDTRADILQTMLSEMYEKNHKLTTTVAKLTNMNSTLLNQVEDRTAEQKVQVSQFPRLDVIEKESQDGDNMHHNNNTPYEIEDNVIASTSEVCALRAQNNALLEKVDRLKVRKKKQANKIVYLKSIVACTASEDLLADFSDTESASTFSLMDSVSGTQLTPLVDDGNVYDDDDDYSSTASSFRRLLASNSDADLSPGKDSSNLSCVITGLAAYRMKAFVSRIQRKVAVTYKEQDIENVTKDLNPVESDNIDEICDMAAEIYAAHVKECPWRTAGLVIQWEPPEPAPTPPPREEVPKQELHTSKTSEADTPNNMILPAHYSVVDHNINDLNSIVSFSETSLSSIGMHSFGENLWI